MIEKVVDLEDAILNEETEEVLMDEVVEVNLIEEEEDV